MTEVSKSSIMDIKYKLIVVGDLNVGKTSILNRFVNNSFDNEYKSTLGVDFLSKIIEYKSIPIKLELWDSAGQEKFRSLIPMYVRSSAIVLIVYEINNKKTFLSVHEWLKFVQGHNKEEPLYVLCGNKSDLKREVTEKEAKEFADKNNMLFFEICAKDGVGVDLMFFSSLVKMPYFDGENDKEIIIKDLIKVNSVSTPSLETVSKEIKVNDNEGNKVQEKGSCKC